MAVAMSHRWSVLLPFDFIGRVTTAGQSAGAPGNTDATDRATWRVPTTAAAGRSFWAFYRPSRWGLNPSLGGSFGLVVVLGHGALFSPGKTPVAC